jgi:MOSC domain-containing protein
VAASVARISIAPVKSFRLVHPGSVMLESGGVVGDRRFWLRDEHGALYAGKRDGRMFRIRPEWDEATRRLSLTFPDGEVVDGVVELGEAVAAELYREPRPSHRVLGPWQDAISAHVGRPLELLWADDGAVDRMPGGGTVSLVSRASLERLREETGAEGPVDGRRFRMMLELDGLDAHEEDTWMGGEIEVGDATIRVVGDVGRCVVTSRDPDSGEIDLPTLAALAGYRREGVNEPLPFGVVASVVAPGRVRVGDIAQPLYSSTWQPAAARS